MFGLSISSDDTRANVVGQVVDTAVSRKIVLALTRAHGAKRYAMETGTRALSTTHAIGL